MGVVWLQQHLGRSLGRKNRLQQVWVPLGHQFYCKILNLQPLQLFVSPGLRRIIHFNVRAAHIVLCSPKLSAVFSWPTGAL